MYNFISSEWYKLIRSRFFYVCMLVHGTVAALMTISVKISGDSYIALAGNVKNISETSTAVQGLLQMVEFSEKGNPAWAAAYGMNYVGIITGAVFVILFMNMEYKKGTMLMLIGRGYSRKKLILSKMLVAIVGSEIMFLIAAFICALMGMVLWGIPAETFVMLPHMFVSIGCNMVLMAGALSIAIVFAVLIQHSGEAIGAYVIGDFLISNAMSIEIGGNFMLKKISNLLFLDRTIGKMSNILNMPSVPWIEMGISLAYMVGAVLICCLLVEKKDLN